MGISFKIFVTYFRISRLIINFLKVFLGSSKIIQTKKVRFEIKTYPKYSFFIS